MMNKGRRSQIEPVSLSKSSCLCSCYSYLSNRKIYCESRHKGKMYEQPQSEKHVAVAIKHTPATTKPFTSTRDKGVNIEYGKYFLATGQKLRSTQGLCGVSKVHAPPTCTSVSRCTENTAPSLMTWTCSSMSERSDENCFGTMIVYPSCFGYSINATTASPSCLWDQR
jgi:hypothetical protein